MASSEAPRNRLGGESSAYLLQHARQPVHWYPWGVEALADAAATNRPILLSIGYAACHWCHVMAHETFDDPAVAGILNAHFISIKVDREERPDIDHLYMLALQALGEQGGWPLTMFLLPTGEPFWGGTYFAPEERWGRPGFATVLRAVLEATLRQQRDIGKTAASLGIALRAMSQPSPGPAPDPAGLARAAAAIVSMADRSLGGFAGRPKFPNFPAHRFLAQRAARGDRQAAIAVDRLLAALCAGGISDHVGGGLFRYSTDVRWLVPHFEKMLYDNAQFVETLALAHARAPSATLERHAAATVTFLQRDLATDAVFASSLDADTPDGEGAFYVWTEGEIDATLQHTSADFKAAFGVTPDGNWGGRSILRRPIDAEVDYDFGPELAALAIARDRRPRPARDDKILADWNGLAIIALCRAATVFSRPAWLQTAEASFATLAVRLRPAGRWHHAWGNGRILAPAQLDDIGAMGLAALSLYETTARPEFLRAARAAVEQAEQWHGPAREGYAMTPADAADLPAGLSVRLRSVTCGAVPSGSGMIAQLLARLYHLTGELVFRDRARLVIEAFAGRYDHPLSSVTLLASAEMLEEATVVVICGDPGSPDAGCLRTAALRSPDPACCVLSLPPDSTLPPNHPAHGKRATDRPLAFVCRGSTCLPPVADAGALSSLLTETGPLR